QMRVFRDNYLVHPQKTARMDWATYSTPEIVSAYYFEAADVNTKCSQNVHFVQSKNDDISAAIEALQAIYPWMKNIVFPPNFQTVYHATQIIIGLTVERFR
ncbi:hypothetical protein EBT31_17465, partial [bacterium]|nr:hypothetical protein [bacterium]